MSNVCKYDLLNVVGKQLETLCLILNYNFFRPMIELIV